MYEQHEPTLIGGPLLDAADPSHGVQPQACAVCGTASGLQRTALPGPAGIVCRSCLDAALKTLGPPTVSSINTCSRPHDGGDPLLYGVVAVWPVRTFHDARQPAIRACPVHLAEAIATLTAQTPLESA